MVAEAGHRLLGVHVDPESPAAGICSNVSMIGSPISRSGAMRPLALLLAADAGGADRDQRPVAKRLGHVGQRRRAQEADDRGDLVGDVCGPVAVGAERIGAELGRQDQRAGVDLGDRQQVEVQRGDDRVAAAAAAQRPEEVGVVVGVDPPLLAVGGDELDRVHAVAGEPVAAPEPAQPAAERVADDAHVGRGAGQRAQALAPGRPRASSSASTPASTRAVCASASISTPRMRSVLIRIVSSSGPSATAPWPVP